VKQRLRPGLALALLLLAALVPVTSALAADKDNKSQAEGNGDKSQVAGLRARIFEVKHRSPQDLARVLRPLASGAKGSSMTESEELKTLTVRDLPENLAAVEEAIKRLDVPVPPKPDIELKMRVLVACAGQPGQVPQDLQAVVKQLQATLNYKGYHPIAAPITQRVRAGSGSWGKGVAPVGPPIIAEATTATYSYSFENVTVGPSPSGGPPLIHVKNLKFSIGNKILGDADIGTGLTLRENEKVVVGTASLKERALIVVLSAKIVR